MENNLVAIKQKNSEKNEHEEEKEIIVLQSQSDFIVLSASEIESPQLVERAENVPVIKVQDKKEKISKKELCLHSMYSFIYQKLESPKAYQWCTFKIKAIQMYV